MNFTREPIILSVITPKEGCKLVLRNTSGNNAEDFFVDAVEIVSFNNAIFFRSLERPKSFFVPTNAYEVFEVKETKMVLKTPVQEKTVKISGKNQEESSQPKSKDKKRLKRRKPITKEAKLESPKKKEGGDANDETEVKQEVSSSVLKKLFPPPNTLIKEKLTRFKNEEFFKENILPLGEEKSADNGDLNEIKQENKPLSENIASEKESSKMEPPKAAPPTKEKVESDLPSKEDSSKKKQQSQDDFNMKKDHQNKADESFPEKKKNDSFNEKIQKPDIEFPKENMEDNKKSDDTQKPENNDQNIDDQNNPLE